MNEPKNGHSQKKAFLAKRMRMENDDRFEVLWESLADREIIEDWERGATSAEDVVDDAKQLLSSFRAWEGHTSSTGQKPKGLVMGEVPVEPTQRERNMTAALREYLAVHAAQRPIVRRFRRECLPDGRLYTDDHDISLLLEEQKVAKAGTDVQQYLDSHRGKPNDRTLRIEFSTGPHSGVDYRLPNLDEMAEMSAKAEKDHERQMEEDWWGKGREGDISWDDFLGGDPTEEDVAEERQRQKEGEGYFGAQLEILGEWLAARYPWENVGDAVVFLISGRPPRLAQPLSATSNAANATYSLAFSPWISEETLMRAYRAIRGPSPGDKTVRVLRFVSGQADEEGRLPSWSTLLNRWNATNPMENFSDKSALRRAYRRAVEALLDFPGLLPLTHP
jgi:hypothetical protein